jgi:hypothetical protein
MQNGRAKLSTPVGLNFDLLATLSLMPSGEKWPCQEQKKCFVYEDEINIKNKYFATK